MRIHRLRGLFLEIDVGGDGLGDPRHALVEVPPLGVDGAHAWIDGATVRLDALADAGVEALKMVEARLDLRPEEADDGHLVAAPEAPADLGEYVSMRWVSWSRIGSGRTSWAARRTSRASASWARRSAWMARGPLRGRAADIGDRVERIDVGKYDGLHLRRRGGRIQHGALEAVEDRLAEAPLDDGMDGRALLLDERLHPHVQLVRAALDGHGKERQDLLDSRLLQRVEIPGPG